MKQLKLMICRPEGRLTVDKLSNAFAGPSGRDVPGYGETHRFYDMRGVTGLDLDFSDLKKLARDESLLRRNCLPVIACYLVTNPVVRGLIRMYQVMMTGRGVDVHVSADVRQLADILGVGVDQLTLGNHPKVGRPKVRQLP